MRSHHISAVFDAFSLPPCTAMDASVAIPTVKGKWTMKYGEHAYYFMNFRTLRGFRIRLSHLDVIRPGWNRLRKAAKKQGKSVSLFRPLTLRYHYRFNILEQVMLMTVPHTVTSVGHGRFVVNLWSWCGYLVVDTAARTVTYHTTSDADDDSVLGSQQWFDAQTEDLYAMSYSLSDSIGRIDNPVRPVAFRIFKHRLGEADTETVWRGELSDYMHDILLSESHQYCVVCELGMYLDEKKEIIPSKVLIIDLGRNRQWVLDRFVVAAHAFFDPDDPNIVYFSNHNFEFKHSGLFKLLTRGAYSVKFRGPASVYKYRLTLDGPREIGVFTQGDFFRLTNMHVFNHRGRKVIAAMGFPDVIFLIDADDMSFIRKIWVRDPVSLKHFYSKKPALIGTIAPSPDGEKLLVQTTGSFQIVDVSTGKRDLVRDYFFGHVCFNHMLSSRDTKWELTGEALL
ncbi:MAG: hypothetical protein K9N55_00950 [Phycisphaerae bacterium]|nr:hypothetical protein [Phycisphaerae bacterium]